MQTTAIPLEDIEQEARRLLESAASQGFQLRVLGGLAVGMHAPDGLPIAISREYKDLDLLTTKDAGRPVAKWLESMGYEANRQFNTLNAGRRLLFYDIRHQRQVDVFVGSFKMCHAIPVVELLHLDPITMPLAELLLTKLQVFHLNEKDQRDILALFFGHDVGDGDDDEINGARIGDLLSGDWGLWRTIKLNLERTREAIRSYDLDPADQDRIQARVETLWTMIEHAPKSGKWKLRDRIGDRKRWYEIPDEVD